MISSEGMQAGRTGRRQPVWDSYGRLSRVPETGELEKIDIQHSDNRRVIERYGAVLGKELSDGLSAWKRGVRRRGWEELLERIESGESDGIVVWHTDRLFRQPRDLERLIELGEKGFRVASAHGQRDLADPDDRFILRIEVAHAARSSDDTQRRIKRRFSTLREQGRSTGGGRRFGFGGGDLSIPKPKPGPDGKPVPRPMVAESLVERERRAIVKATDDVLADVSLGAIAAEWNAAQLRTVNGKQWTPAGVRSTLLRPELAGIVEHDGQVVGRAEGEPVLEAAKFERLRTKFNARRRGRVLSEKENASGIVRCHECGTTLTVRNHVGTYKDGSKRKQYRCDKRRVGACGRVTIDKNALDAEVQAFVVERLSNKRYAAAIAAAYARASKRLGEIEQELAEIEKLQTEIAGRMGRREMSLDAHDAANVPLTADLARLTAERKALTEATPTGETAPKVFTASEVDDRYKHADSAERRAMLTQALGTARMTVRAATAEDGTRRRPIERVVKPTEPPHADLPPSLVA